MVERFRTGWAAAMRWPAALLIRLHVSPDAVTWTGMAGTVLVALVCFPQGWLWQGALLELVFIFSDGVDGQMARMLGRTSRWGSFLDSTLDRFGDAALIGGVVLYYAGPGNSRWFAALALVGLVMGQVTSYVKARGEATGFTVVGGLAARADRIIVLLLGCILTGAGLWWALPIGLAYLAIAGAITVGQRMHQVYRQAAASPQDRP